MQNDSGFSKAFKYLKHISVCVNSLKAKEGKNPPFCILVVFYFPIITTLYKKRRQYINLPNLPSIAFLHVLWFNEINHIYEFLDSSHIYDMFVHTPFLYYYNGKMETAPIISFPFQEISLSNPLKANHLELFTLMMLVEFQ